MAEPALTALEMMEFEGKNNIIEKVRQGQTLMNVIQAQQQTIAKMSAVLQLDGGAVNPSKPGRGLLAAPAPQRLWGMSLIAPS